MASPCEGDVKNLLMPLYLQCHRLARLHSRQRGAQTLQRGDRCGVQSMDYIPGLQWNLPGTRAESSRGHNHAARDAQVRQCLRKLKRQFNSEDLQRPDQIFYRVDQIDEGVLFMRPFGEANVYFHSIGPSQNFERGVITGLVQIKALSKLRQAADGHAVDAENYILNLNAGSIRGTARRNVGDNNAEISFQAQGRR